MTRAKGGCTLVTGAGGFVGSWLVPALTASGHDVTGVRKPDFPCAPLDIPWIDTELGDEAAVDSLLRQTKPAYVVHLAGIAQPPLAAREPLEALRSNVIAVAHLLNAVAAHAPDARVLLISSGAVYGTCAADAGPFVETDDLAPQDIYAATKVAAEALAVEIAERSGLQLIRARPFNHSGPQRPNDYAESSFAEQIARIERGLQEPELRVGNLEGVRDFSDVRDVVAAYLLLLERGEVGRVYNVGSGRGRSVREVLDLLLELSDAKPEVKIDPERFRASDPARLASVGDTQKLRELGWVPEIPLEQTLGELLDYWRSAL